jgi:hypothetical protein
MMIEDGKRKADKSSYLPLIPALRLALVILIRPMFLRARHISSPIRASPILVEISQQKVSRLLRNNRPLGASYLPRRAGTTRRSDQQRSILQAWPFGSSRQNRQGWTHLGVELESKSSRKPFPLSRYSISAKQGHEITFPKPMGREKASNAPRDPLPAGFDSNPAE